MGSSGMLSLDLNELPPAEEDENGCADSRHEKTLTSCSAHREDGRQGIPNNLAFKHASSSSLFQPFVRDKSSQDAKSCSKAEDDMDANRTSTSAATTSTGTTVSQVGLSHDAAGSSDAADSTARNRKDTEFTAVHGTDTCGRVPQEPDNAGDLACQRNVTVHQSLGNEITGNMEQYTKACLPDGDSNPAVKPIDVKGVKAKCTFKFANSPGKQLKIDEHKEAMLGKKRSRQTQFINLEDVKQAGVGNTRIPTPRRQTTFPALASPRGLRSPSSSRSSHFEGRNLKEAGDPHESLSSPIPRKGSWKQLYPREAKTVWGVPSRKSGDASQRPTDQKPDVP